MGGNIIVSVSNGFVIALMFAGFFILSITESDVKAPKIAERTDNISIEGMSEKSMASIKNIIRAGMTLTKKIGMAPKTIPVKYIGKVIGDAT